MLIETMERRRLFAVTVTQDYPGYYEINGDDSGNTIAVTVSQNDDTFTLDGTTYTDVAFILVNSGNGNDAVSLISVDGSGMIGAAVNGQGGDDSITVNFDAAVSGGDGNDSIYLSDSYRGEAHGGAGDDKIYISGDCVDAVIMGDDGNDLIDCSNNNCGVTVHGGEGDDTIYGSAYCDTIYGDGGTNQLIGNGGNDTFYTRDGYGDSVDGGDGTNMLYGNGTEASVNNVQYINYA
jgi:Ca2+-binding RTX toxin-like protein